MVAVLPYLTPSYKPRSHMGNRSQTSTPWAKVSFPVLKLITLGTAPGMEPASWWEGSLGGPGGHAGFQQQRLRRWKKASPSKGSGD